MREELGLERGKGKLGKWVGRDQADGDWLKERVVEVRGLISTVGQAGIGEAEIRKVIGKAIERLSTLKGHVRVRTGVANRRYRKVPADKTTLGQKVKEWQVRCKTVEECFRAVSG